MVFLLYAIIFVLFSIWCYTWGRWQERVVFAAQVLWQDFHFCAIPVAITLQLDFLNFYLLVYIIVAVVWFITSFSIIQTVIIHEMLRKTRQGNTTQQKDKATQHNSPKAYTTSCTMRDMTLQLSSIYLVCSVHTFFNVCVVCSTVYVVT